MPVATTKTSEANRPVEKHGELVLYDWSGGRNMLMIEAVMWRPGKNRSVIRQMSMLGPLSRKERRVSNKRILTHPSRKKKTNRDLSNAKTQQG
jgi:hypothetical protein